MKIKKKVIYLTREENGLGNKLKTEIEFCLNNTNIFKVNKCLVYNKSLFNHTFNSLLL